MAAAHQASREARETALEQVLAKVAQLWPK
jgi:hypothetical protein